MLLAYGLSHSKRDLILVGRGLHQGYMGPWGHGQRLDKGRCGQAIGLTCVRLQHVRTFTGDGSGKVRALPGGFAYGAWKGRGPEAGTPAPSDRDVSARASGLRLAGGTRGGRASGACRFGRVYRASGRVVGASGSRPARGPYPLG